jgi:thiol-disulfide isomerase/thioredoxin
MRSKLLYLIPLTLALASGIWLAQTRQAEPPPAAREALWQMSFPDVHGQRQPLSQWRGQVVVLNFWASWCAPCREEIPTFNAFAAAHPGQVQVLSVNFDAVVADTLTTQVRGLGIEFPTLLRDPRAEFGVPPPMGLPETLVLDRGGKLLRVLAGPQTRADLEAVLAALPP